MTAGDNLWTDATGRVELELGSSVVRLAANTSLTILNLDERQVMMRTSPPPTPVPFVTLKPALAAHPGQPVDEETLRSLQPRTPVATASRQLAPTVTAPAITRPGPRPATQRSASQSSGPSVSGANRPAAPGSPYVADLAARQAAARADLEARHATQQAQLQSRQQEEQRRAQDERTRQQMQQRQERERHDLEQRQIREHAQMEQRQDKERRQAAGRKSS
jgi:hypothetical protein